MLNKLFGWLVGEVDCLAAQEVEGDGLVRLLDLHSADVLVADQILKIGFRVFQQDKTHGESLVRKRRWLYSSPLVDFTGIWRDIGGMGVCRIPPFVVSP